MAFQASIIAIGTIMVQIALNQLGPTSVAAHAAAQKIDQLAILPMMSFGVTMATYSAQNYGARNMIVFGLACVNVSEIIIFNISCDWSGIILNLFGPILIRFRWRRAWGGRWWTTILPYKRDNI